MYMGIKARQVGAVFLEILASNPNQRVTKSDLAAYCFWKIIEHPDD